MATVTTMQKINQKISCNRAKESEQTWVKRASRAMGRLFHVPKEELFFGWLPPKKSAQYQGFVNLFHFAPNQQGYTLQPVASTITDSIGNVIQMFSINSDIYFVKNPMKAPDQYQSEHLYSYRTIVIDIHAPLSSIQETIDANGLARYGAKVLRDEVNHELFSGIEPNMIQVSGCSIQVYWSFYPLLAKEADSASLYRETAGKLCDYMELWIKQYPELADFRVNRSTSTNAVGLVRLPESIHSAVAETIGKEWAHIETYSPKRKTVHKCKKLLTGANYYCNLATEFSANNDSALSSVIETAGNETVTEEELPDIPTAYDDETDDVFNSDDYDLNAIFGEEFFLACSDIVPEAEQFAKACDCSAKPVCDTKTSETPVVELEPSESNPEQQKEPEAESVQNTEVALTLLPRSYEYESALLTDDVYNMTPYEASQRYKAVYRLLWKTYPNKIDIGMRDRTLFVLCNIALKFMPISKMFRFILNANKKLFKVPLSEQEVRLYMRASTRIANEDGSKGYKLSTDYICNLLGLDRSQFPRIIDYKKQNLIHAYEKQERQKKKQAMMRKAKELHDSGMTYIEIAKVMGKTRQTISTWIRTAEELPNRKPVETETVHEVRNEEVKAQQDMKTVYEETSAAEPNTKAPAASTSSEQTSCQAKPKAFQPIDQTALTRQGCIRNEQERNKSKLLTAASCV